MNLLKTAPLKLALLSITINAQTTINRREQLNTFGRAPQNYKGNPPEYFSKDLKSEIKSVSLSEKK